MIQLQNLRDQKQVLQKQRENLQQDLNQKLKQMEAVSLQIAEFFFAKTSISQLQQKKIQLLKQTDGQNEEIRTYQIYFQEQKRLLRERLDSIQIFNNKFNDEYDACQKKFHTIQIRDTVTRGIKRLLLLQLCTIFFDKDTQRLFYGLHKYSAGQPMILTPQEEESLACALGYLGLLIHHIAKVKGLVLKYDFRFKGSRSYIQYNNEQWSLFSGKPSNQNKLSQSFGLLQSNLHLVMEELSIQRQWRNQSMAVIVGKIGEMLWVDA